jgi:hypothetical protein
MLDWLTRYISGISVLSIAGLSVFNVGYFWRIGLHYLGLTDFSNVVYSFGLAAVVLAALSLFLPAVVGHFAGISAGATRRAIWTTYVVLIFAGVLAWVSLFGLSSHLSQDSGMLIAMIFGLFALVSRLWLRFKALGDRSAYSTSFATLLSVLTVFQAGLVVCDLQIASIDTYNFNTKSGPINEARIIRSSSNGFILFVDGRSMFLPLSEVLNLKSNFSPADRH